MSEWRNVVGYPGYQVSFDGRVKRKDGYILSPALSRQGNKRYHTVGLWKDGLRRSCSVHVIVIEAFLHKRPWGMDVDHIDDDGTHNSADNLRYLTRSENILRSKYDYPLSGIDRS